MRKVRLLIAVVGAALVCGGCQMFGSASGHASVTAEFKSVGAVRTANAACNKLFARLARMQNIINEARHVNHKMLSLIEKRLGLVIDVAKNPEKRLAEVVGKFRKAIEGVTLSVNVNVQADLSAFASASAGTGVGSEATASFRGAVKISVEVSVEGSEEAKKRVAALVATIKKVIEEFKRTPVFLKNYIYEYKYLYKEFQAVIKLVKQDMKLIWELTKAVKALAEVNIQAKASVDFSASASGQLSGGASS